MPDTSRTLTPDFVYEQWRKTEERRKRQHKAMRKAKYAYESRLWKGESGNVAITGSTEEGPITVSDDKVLVEVSRMPGIIQTYTGFLFPRSPRTVITPDVEGNGNPSLSQSTVNRWFGLERIHRKISNNIGQSLLYRGSALKLGIDLTKRRPLDRVWGKVVPWWDLVLDWDVQDVDEERFRGHEYWEDVAVLERRLGVTIPDEVALEYRVPHFDRDMSTGDRGANLPAPGNAPIESKRFVRVLEWYNFVDDFVTPTGKIRGRFEIYLVNSLMKGGDDRKPLKTMAMPFSFADGEPCAPLALLIFDSEMEHPLRGLSFADRVYSQCYELALLRTAEANALRRDARLALYDKGVLDETALGRMVQGEDGAFIGIEMPTTGGKTFDDVFYPVQFPQINGDHSLYESSIERDLNQGANVPKFARGEAMGARTTAYEVKQLNQYMENRLGEMARTKDAWIAEVARIFLRILIMACKAPALLPTAKKGQKPDKIKFAEGPKREERVVTVEDLDAEFEIGVVDAASTPMSREARRMDLASLMPQLLVLWEKVEAGNPMAVTLLNNLIDLYDLSADFNLKNLQTLADRMKVEAEAKKRERQDTDAEKVANALIEKKLAGEAPGPPVSGPALLPTPGGPTASPAPLPPAVMPPTPPMLPPGSLPGM